MLPRIGVKLLIVMVICVVNLKCPSNNIIIQINAGLELQWISEPPMIVEEGEKFNVSYLVTAGEQFFQSSMNVYPGKK